MLTTPSTAFVGSPLFVDSIGIAWNARYRYDEPSTRTSGLALILTLVVRLVGLRRRRLGALDWPRVLGQRERSRLSAGGDRRGNEGREQRDAGTSRHVSSLRFKSAAMRRYASRNGRPCFTTSSFACSAAYSSGGSSMFSGRKRTFGSACAMIASTSPARSMLRKSGALSRCKSR